MAHPSPVPPSLQDGKSEARSEVTKSVRWNGTDQPENKLAIATPYAMNGSPVTNGTLPGTQPNGDIFTSNKYISLASALSNPEQQPVGTMSSTMSSTMSNGSLSASPSRHFALQRLPFKATLHRGKQIPGRYFPSPSYTEFQRDVLESRSTPRKIVKKFKPKSETPEQLFPSGRPIKPRSVGDKSTWVANQAFNRGAQMTAEDGRQPLVMTPADDPHEGQLRQYSIPATTRFHDGTNDSGIITGSSKTLHFKPVENGEVPQSVVKQKQAV